MSLVYSLVSEGNLSSLSISPGFLREKIIPPRLPCCRWASEPTPQSGDAELPIIEATERRQRMECLHQCIQGLAAAEREVFLEYQYYTDNPQNTRKLAEHLGLTPGGLKTKAHRIKHKIESCTRKCLACISNRMAIVSAKVMDRDDR